MTLHLTAADWLALFGHFLSLSLLAVGGAVTTAPDMHRFLVDRQHWLTDPQFSASIAIAQALIDEAVPVIVLAPSGPLFEKTVSNMQEVRARGGKIVLVSDREGLDEAGEGCMATIEMPKVHPLIAPLVYAIPVQLLAYHVACVKGTDVDQPRNLAKSVTVE